MDPNWAVMLAAGSLVSSLSVALVAAWATLTGLLWAMSFPTSALREKASR